MSTFFDADRALHRYESRPVRRLPTIDMGNAEFHVGAVSWSNPWETTPAGKLSRWVIARHDVVRGITTFVRGRARDDRPEPRISRDIERIIGEESARTWVGVSAKRLALYRHLDAAQVPVTCGGEHNQGLSDAVQAMRQDVAEGMRTPTAKRFSMSPPPALPRTPPGPPRLRLWEPHVSTVSSCAEGRAVIACDGSYELFSGHGAYAAVSSHGSARAASVVVASSVDVEVDALLAGLELGIASGVRSFSLVSDSLAAIDLLENMMSARNRRGPSPRHARVWSLRRQLRADVVVHHARAREGHVLHGRADALAFAVRRASTAPRSLSEEPLARVAEQLLSTPTAGLDAHVPADALKRMLIPALEVLEGDCAAGGVVPVREGVSR